MVFHKKNFFFKSAIWLEADFACVKFVKIMFVCCKCATTRDQQPINFYLQEYFEHFEDLEAFVHSTLDYYLACPFEVGGRD